jgi:hypothetical protein
MAVTVPARSARTGISIFIDSRRMTVSPWAMVSPTSQDTTRTLATISARISVDWERAMEATLAVTGA